MKTPKHTPGPWSIARTRSGEEYGSIHGSDGMLVATLGYRVAVGSDEDMSNSRLISAAPDLLEALRESVKWLQSAQADEPADYHNEPLDDAIEQALAAIAKAEGRQ